MPATSRQPPAPEAHDVDIVPVAALLADGTRAAMLTALLDDRPLAAGELARVAGVSPATASAHLARLLDGGLVTVVSQGRHRYYRLAGHEVAGVLEVLGQLSPPMPVRSLRQSQQARALAQARTCYDQLAGRAGVALLDALLARGVLVPASGPARPVPARPVPGRGRDGDGGRLRAVPAPQAHSRPVSFEVTAGGERTLLAFGINVRELRTLRRRFAGECLDWTERRPHLNGALGAALTSRLLELGWIERAQRRRAVRVTPAGRDGLAATFGWPAAG